MDFNLHLEISRLASEMNDMRNDGWTQLNCKSKLLALKYQLDAVLEDSPVFVGEDKIIAELEQEKIIRLLKKQSK